MANSDVRVRCTELARSRHALSRVLYFPATLSLTLSLSFPSPRHLTGERLSLFFCSEALIFLEISTPPRFYYFLLISRLVRNRFLIQLLWLSGCLAAACWAFDLEVYVWWLLFLSSCLINGFDVLSFLSFWVFLGLGFFLISLFRFLSMPCMVAKKLYRKPKNWYLFYFPKNTKDFS